MKAKKLDDFDFDNFVVDDGCGINDNNNNKNDNNMVKTEFKLYEEENIEKPKTIYSNQETKTQDVSEKLDKMKKENAKAISSANFFNNENSQEN